MPEPSGAKKGKKISSAFTGGKKKKGKVRMDDEMVAAMGRKGQNYFGGGEEE